MRFGSTLRHCIYKPWKEEYIDYAKLKKLLREDDSPTSSPSRRSGDVWTDDDAEAFFAELVNVQLEKVKRFHAATYRQLDERTTRCETELEPIASTLKAESESESGSAVSHDETDRGSGGVGIEDGEAEDVGPKKPRPSADERRRIVEHVTAELDAISSEVNELERYTRINYTGFLKIAKKHDRKRGARVSSVRPIVKSILAQLPFVQEDYSPLLYRLSSMFAFLRAHVDGAKTRPVSVIESVVGPDSYTSHKFWVHLDNLLELKTVILRRLPVLVYDGEQDPTTTSIYFDDADFSLYSAKVEHASDASSLRLKWSGRLSQKPTILFEKKTVRLDGSSEEERIDIKEKNISSFLRGESSMEKTAGKRMSRSGENSNEAKSFRRGVDDIQAFVRDAKLQPVLRANYLRTAFQVPGDTSVRISIDTNIALIREDARDADRPCREPDDWHRRDIDDAEMEYPFPLVRKGEMHKFPHAVLDIKVKNGRRYEWIEDLMNSHLVRETAKFSKFTHGVAQLFEDNVNTFPFWHTIMDVDIRQDPTDAFEREQAKRQKQQEDEIAVGSMVRPKSGSSVPIRAPGHISPVGSPVAKSGSSRYSKRKSLASVHSRGHSLGAAAPGLDDMAEEADNAGSDEEPVARSSSPTGLAALFPAFSGRTLSQRRRRDSSSVVLPAGVTRPEKWIKDAGPLRVEAKVWLANQRTFLKWQHVTVLLASLGLALFNAAEDGGVARALATAYTLVALFAGGWGYAVFVWRSDLIRRRSGRDFDAMLGPVIVCLGLVVALCVNFVFKVGLSRVRVRDA